jgi:protoporphyrinogen oxidase
MAGFGAAHRLHEQRVPAVVFEKNPYYGGHTATFQYDGGFTFDDGPHISFTKVERMQKLFAENVGGKYQTLNARVNNYWKGYWIKHPAQVNLYGLPEELVVRIIKDFVEAQQAPAGEIRNYRDWLLATFGRTFAETFPMEYTIKYHTTTADNMSTDWLGPRLYRPSLEEVLRGALSAKTPDVHYIDHFRYPTHGGFVSYLHRFARETEVRLNHKVVSIDPREKNIGFANGTSVEFDHIISSVPLPDLVPTIRGAPREVIEASQRLACSELVVVNVAVRRPDLVDAHWSYFYDRDVFFTRVSTPHMQSPNNVPPGCGSLQAECYYSRKYRPLDRKPDECIEPVLNDLRRCKILREDDEILFTNTLHSRYANVIFDLERAGALEIVHGYLRDVGIHWCGRYGDWAYIWTDESFMSGERAAEQVLRAMG